jgi:hypothetical protein
VSVYRKPFRRPYSTHRWIGTLGATTQSSSFTADAIVLREQTGSFTADAVIQRTQASSFTADAVLRREQSGSFTADAYLLTIVSGSLTGDAVLFKTQTGTLTADAVLFKTQAGSFTADAVLLKTQAASFTADAVLFKTQAGSFTADAVITAGEQFGSFTADAILLKTQTGTISADAVILRSQSGSFTADAVLLRIQTGSFTADAVVRAIQAGTFTADAVLFRTQAGSFTADAVVVRTQTGSFTADAVLRATTTGSFTANATLLRTQSGSFTADADLIQGFFRADAFIAGEQASGSFTADAVVVITSRFYLNSGTAQTVSPAFSSGWESTTSASRRRMGLPARASSTKISVGPFSETSASNTFDRLAYQFTSDPLPNDAVICGPIRGFVRVSENNQADADLRSQMHVRVVSADGSTTIGTLLDFDASALVDEWPLTEASRKFPLNYTDPGTNATPVTVSAGQRIVVEIGFRAHNTTTSSRGGVFRTGHTYGGTDFSATDQTTDLNPWFDIRATADLLHGGSFTADARVVYQTISSFSASAVILPIEPIRARHNRYTEHYGIDYADSQVLYSQFGIYYYHETVHSVIRDLDERISALETGTFKIRQRTFNVYARLKKLDTLFSITANAWFDRKGSFTANAYKAPRFTADAFIRAQLTFDALIVDPAFAFSDSIAGAPEWGEPSTPITVYVDSSTLTHESGDPASRFSATDQSGWVKFTITTESTVHVYVEQEGIDPMAEIFGPGASPTNGSWRYEAFWGDEYSELLPAGTYWIGVKPFDPDDVDYYIGVTFWVE